MSESRRAALRIATTYAIIGVTWILLSDQFVARLPLTIGLALQSVKGFGFVVVTGVAVYLLVERLSDQISAEARRSSSVERMLGQVVTTVPVGVLLTSDDGTITFINTAAEEMLGFPSVEAIGRGIDGICCADEAQGSTHVGELMRTGEVDGIEVGGRGGAPVRSVLARAAEIDPSMPASGYVIAIADITEAHRARAASERQVSAYRFLAASLAVVMRAPNERSMLSRIAEVAVESGHYRAAWAVGWDPESRRHYDLATPGLGPRGLETATMMRDLADTESAGMPVSQDGVSVSNDIIRDPANVWHSAAVEEGLGATAGVTISNAGRLIGGLVFFTTQAGAFNGPEVEMLHSLRDAIEFVAGRMRLERSRLDAEHQDEDRDHRVLFHGNPAPMWVYDVGSLAFLDVNDAAIAKYGYSRQEFLEMTIADIRPKDHLARLKDSVHEADGFGDAGVWTHMDKAGREFPVQIFGHTLEWDGREAELIMALEVARIE